MDDLLAIIDVVLLVKYKVHVFWAFDPDCVCSTRVGFLDDESSFIAFLPHSWKAVQVILQIEGIFLPIYFHFATWSSVFGFYNVWLALTSCQFHIHLARKDLIFPVLENELATIDPSLFIKHDIEKRWPSFFENQHCLLACDVIEVQVIIFGTDHVPVALLVWVQLQILEHNLPLL